MSPLEHTWFLQSYSNDDLPPLVMSEDDLVRRGNCPAFEYPSLTLTPDIGLKRFEETISSAPQRDSVVDRPTHKLHLQCWFTPGEFSEIF